MGNGAYDRSSLVRDVFQQALELNQACAAALKDGWVIDLTLSPEGGVNVAVEGPHPPDPTEEPAQ